MMVDFHGKPFHPLHSGVEGPPTQNQKQARSKVYNGTVHCNDLVFFFYLTDVFPGDGGLIVVPGRHKSNFSRPSMGFFYPDSYTEDGGYNEKFFSTEVPEGVANFMPRAGDVVIISELVTHEALIWAPVDRDRRFLTLRYMQQHEAVRGSFDPFPAGVMAGLSPATLELIESAPYDHIKEIVQRQIPAPSAGRDRSAGV